MQTHIDPYDTYFSHTVEAKENPTGQNSEVITITPDVELYAKALLMDGQIGGGIVPNHWVLLKSGKVSVPSTDRIATLLFYVNADDEKKIGIFETSILPLDPKRGFPYFSYFPDIEKKWMSLGGNNWHVPIVVPPLGLFYFDTSGFDVKDWIEIRKSLYFDANVDFSSGKLLNYPKDALSNVLLDTKIRVGKENPQKRVYLPYPNGFPVYPPLTVTTQLLEDYASQISPTTWWSRDEKGIVTTSMSNREYLKKDALLTVQKILSLGNDSVNEWIAYYASMFPFDYSQGGSSLWRELELEKKFHMNQPNPIINAEVLVRWPSAETMNANTVVYGCVFIHNRFAMPRRERLLKNPLIEELDRLLSPNANSHSTIPVNATLIVPSLNSYQQQGWHMCTPSLLRIYGVSRPTFHLDFLSIYKGHKAVLMGLLQVNASGSEPTKRELVLKSLWITLIILMLTAARMPNVHKWINWFSRLRHASPEGKNFMELGKFLENHKKTYENSHIKNVTSAQTTGNEDFPAVAFDFLMNHTANKNADTWHNLLPIHSSHFPTGTLEITNVITDDTHPTMLPSRDVARIASNPWIDFPHLGLQVLVMPHLVFQPWFDEESWARTVLNLLENSSVGAFSKEPSGKDPNRNHAWSLYPNFPFPFLATHMLLRGAIPSCITGGYQHYAMPIAGVSFAPKYLVVGDPLTGRVPYEEVVNLLESQSIWRFKKAPQSNSPDVNMAKQPHILNPANRDAEDSDSENWPDWDVKEPVAETIPKENLTSKSGVKKTPSSLSSAPSSSLSSSSSSSSYLELTSAYEDIDDKSGDIWQTGENAFTTLAQLLHVSEKSPIGEHVQFPHETDTKHPYMSVESAPLGSSVQDPFYISHLFDPTIVFSAPSFGPSTYGPVPSEINTAGGVCQYFSEKFKADPELSTTDRLLHVFHLHLNVIYWAQWDCLYKDSLAQTTTSSIFGATPIIAAEQELLNLKTKEAFHVNLQEGSSTFTPSATTLGAAFGKLAEWLEMLVACGWGDQVISLLEMVLLDDVKTTPHWHRDYFLMEKEDIVKPRKPGEVEMKFLRLQHVDLFSEIHYEKLKTHTADVSAILNWSLDPLRRLQDHCFCNAVSFDQDPWFQKNNIGKTFPDDDPIDKLVLENLQLFTTAMKKAQSGQGVELPNIEHILNVGEFNNENGEISWENSIEQKLNTLFGYFKAIPLYNEELRTAKYQSGMLRDPLEGTRYRMRSASTHDFGITAGKISFGAVVMAFAEICLTCINETLYGEVGMRASGMKNIESSEEFLARAKGRRSSPNKLDLGVELVKERAHLKLPRKANDTSGNSVSMKPHILGSFSNCEKYGDELLQWARVVQMSINKAQKLLAETRRKIRSSTSRMMDEEHLRTFTSRKGDKTLVPGSGWQHRLLNRGGDDGNEDINHGPLKPFLQPHINKSYRVFLPDPRTQETWRSLAEGHKHMENRISKFVDNIVPLPGAYESQPRESLELKKTQYNTPQGPHNANQDQLLNWLTFSELLDNAVKNRTAFIKTSPNILQNDFTNEIVVFMETWSDLLQSFLEKPRSFQEHTTANFGETFSKLEEHLADLAGKEQVSLDQMTDDNDNITDTLATNESDALDLLETEVALATLLGGYTTLAASIYDDNLSELENRTVDFENQFPIPSKPQTNAIIEFWSKLLQLHQFEAPCAPLIELTDLYITVIRGSIHRDEPKIISPDETFALSNVVVLHFSKRYTIELSQFFDDNIADVHRKIYYARQLASALREHNRFIVAYTVLTGILHIANRLRFGDAVIIKPKIQQNSVAYARNLLLNYGSTKAVETLIFLLRQLNDFIDPEAKNQAQKNALNELMDLVTPKIGAISRSFDGSDDNDDVDDDKSSMTDDSNSYDSDIPDL